MFSPFRNLLSETSKLLLVWKNRLVNFLHPVPPDEEWEPQRLLVYSSFPWAPLIWCVFLPVLFFLWGLSRRWLREISLDFPLLLSSLPVPSLSLLALLPALLSLVWHLSGPLRGLYGDLRDLRLDHLWALNLWAYHWPAYDGLHSLFQRKLKPWLNENVQCPQGSLYFLFQPYRWVIFPSWILRYQILLIPLELMLHQGKLEFYFLLCPWIFLIHGLLRPLSFFLRSYSPDERLLSRALRGEDLNYTEVEILRGALVYTPRVRRMLVRHLKNNHA